MTRSPATSHPTNPLHILLDQLGYRVDGREVATGRPGRLTVPLRTPGGVPVMAKLHPDGTGELAFANMTQLWHSPFGRNRNPPGLPEPLDYVPEAGALITERVEGRPLVEFGCIGPAQITESMRLLADLHTCGVVPQTRRGGRGILRSVDRKLNRIIEIAPQFAGHIRPVVQMLHKRRLKDTGLVCAHGDFSARNVVWGPNRAVLVDWDRLQQADPARDIAYFGVWPWREAIRRGQTPNRELLDAAVEAYGRFRPDCVPGEQLSFHVGAGLVRMCCSLVELWPEQACLVPGLAKAALRELECDR